MDHVLTDKDWMEGQFSYENETSDFTCFVHSQYPMFQTLMLMLTYINTESKCFFYYGVMTASRFEIHANNLSVQQNIFI